MDNFGSRLVAWYENNKRDLPWRRTSDPYKIWLSEIILQQTRIDQGLEYYKKFVSTFPDIINLASASPDKVFKMWQGLGYYNRAQNMLETARLIADKFNGKMPTEFENLVRLKGIGNYSAAAIASIAFDKPIPVVDGNVFRVLARLFAIDTPINSSAGKNEFEALAAKLMKQNKPGVFNQAMMEFGALFCKPKNPDCENCIFGQDCKAWQLKRVAEFPVKLKKIPVKKRFFYYLILETEKNGERAILMKKRNEKDIWKNLYDFPLIESDKDMDLKTVIKKLNQKFKIEEADENLVGISKKYKHQLTHQQINAVFIHIHPDHFNVDEAENSVILVNKNKITHYPVSRLIERYLQDQKMI